ncbi:MAG: P-II family nitrogen regulator [Nitrosopumilus sp. H8]|nr:MAG: P-II family nitrogen regulator [Nitrosopumilus sp. H13]RNJ79003.1 MAG: P-II family nitrogen regulator [Nitrosopumilus sp. H8]
MKRIEATIQAGKIGAVSAAISDMVSGFTITDGNGRGSGQRRKIRAGRGTDTVIAEYNRVAVITSVVKDSDVDAVTAAIIEAAYTGRSGDGIITVSEVGSMLNIASGKSGSEAL